MKLLTGYLATLDVLGFSELLYRDGYSAKLREYLACINEIVRPAHEKTECVVFSDTVVLTTSGEDLLAFKGLIKACSAAFHGLLMREIPVRGAVAFGKYWRESTSGSVFLAGRPIVEAYYRERGQKWVGTMLCPSVLYKELNIDAFTVFPEKGEIEEDDFDESSFDLAIRLQPAAVPYQEPGSNITGDMTGYGVVPIDPGDASFKSAARSVRQVRRSLEDLRLKAPSPSAQAKYGSTLRWLEAVQQRLDDAARAVRERNKPGKALPLRVRSRVSAS